MGMLKEPAEGMVPTIPAGASASPDPWSRALVRRLELSGLAPTEAGNVVAYLIGLKPVASGWRASELDHLRFLQSLVADGRLVS